MYRRSGGIDSCSLYLSTRWMGVVSFMPQPLYPWGKSTWFPLNRRLGGTQRQKIPAPTKKQI